MSMPESVIRAPWSAV